MSRELTVPRQRPGRPPPVKKKIAFPQPTLKLLKQFPFAWKEDQVISHAWGKSYEHFIEGTFEEKTYLFVLKGSAYGRTYWVYSDEKKPLIKVLNLEQLEICLKALTAKDKGSLVEYLIHPSEKIRKLAEAKIREFERI